MTRRTLVQLGIAALLLAGVVGTYAFWYALLGKASAESAALASEIQHKTQDVARVAATKLALEPLAADEASIRGYLVEQDEIVPFLGRLEQAGVPLGSTVEVLSVSEESLNERGRITLSLKITGSFDAVLRTLGAIEYGPFDSSISSVTFDTTDGEGGTPSWTAAATFTFGTQPETL